VERAKMRSDASYKGSRGTIQKEDTAVEAQRDRIVATLSTKKRKEKKIEEKKGNWLSSADASGCRAVTSTCPQSPKPTTSSRTVYEHPALYRTSRLAVLG
jgi:hypothetical protein